MMKYCILMLLMTVWMSVSAIAQNAQPAKPCTQLEAKQFDFWIGEWDLTWQGPQGGLPEGQVGKAVNIINSELGGCVIAENFSFADSSYTGRSWSVYSAGKKQWQQTWVDNSGSYLLFTGEFSEGKMILQTQPYQRGDKTFVSRMVFKNIQKNSLDWDWQRSDDNGKTWKDVWNIHYQRKMTE